MSIKGTKTERNILTAFAGESQARNRYTYFASVATKEGYRLIADVYTETADQECQHAKRLFKLLEGGDAEIQASYPAGKISSTLENLKASANGEHEEYADMYPSFAKTAIEEGFNDIAQIFLSIASAEKYHERRFKYFIEHLEKGDLFSREQDVIFKCKNCGYHLKGKDVPEKCPACNHEIGHFIEVMYARSTEDSIL